MLSIYKASAGSGKTYTLASKYIELLLGYHDASAGKRRLYKSPRDTHRSILAITFTNKATEEMKRRIMHELALIAGMEPFTHKKSGYVEPLKKLYGCSDEELRQAAAMALQNLLFDFGRFNVSTIDSFFQTVLRTFAREAELSGNYDLELSKDLSVAYGLNELFTSLNINPGTRQANRLVEWIGSYLIQEFRAGHAISLLNPTSRAYGAVLKLISGLTNELFAIHYDRMMEYLADPSRLENFVDGLHERRRLMLGEVGETAQGFLKALENSGIDSDTINKNVFKQISNAIGGTLPKGIETLSKLIDNPDSLVPASKRRSLGAVPEELLTSAVKAASSICRSVREMPLIEMLLSNTFTLGILSDVQGNINRYNAENNTLLLSDTNGLLKRIIGGEEAPFVYERMGVWFHNLLIDEFQDTSRLQWENLRPLVSESVSTGHDSLIIGDEKQSIYRFRNAEPSLLRNHVQVQFGHLTEISGDTEESNRNWRSSVEVIRFNNLLFRTMASNLGHSEIYSNVTQQIPESNLGHHGYVKVTAIDTDSNPDFSEATLQLMGAEIKRQLQSGRKPSDIAILTRRKEDGYACIDYLMKLKMEDETLPPFNIISDDLMRIDSSPAVRMIVSLLRNSLEGPQPEEPEDGKRCSVSSARIMRMTSHFDFAVSNGQTPENALRQAIAGQNDDNGQLADSMKMRCPNLISLVERLIARFLPESMVASQNIYVSAFADLVAEYCSRGINDVQTFLRDWDASLCGTPISAPDDDNAIRVMTIHKSKGLEFKCVHIPFARGETVYFKGAEWFDTSVPGVPESLRENMPPLIPIEPGTKMVGTPFESQYREREKEQSLDSLNIYYVAFTRAVDELIVNYPIPAKSGGKNLASWLHEALAQAVPEGASLTDGVMEYGEPTRPGPDRSKPRTAMDPDPDLDCEVEPYYTCERDDLWEGTQIEDGGDMRTSPRERGKTLHRLLARVMTADDLPLAVRDLRRRTRDDDLCDEIEGLLRHRLADDDVARWFAKDARRVLCERPLVAGSGGSVLRPDRVVWGADGSIDVIDYKFGDEYPEAYTRQVRGYVKALRAMGHEHVRGFVWYVEKGEVVEV